MENSIRLIIKVPAKLSVAHWCIVLAYANYIYRYVLFTKYHFQYMVKRFITLGHGGKLKYAGNQPYNLTLENVDTEVYYYSISITLAPSVTATKPFSIVLWCSTPGLGYCLKPETLEQVVKAYHGQVHGHICQEIQCQLKK